MTPPSAQFDWQITLLFEVLGADFPATQLRNAHLAQILDIDASGITQRRSGKTALRIGEAAAIIVAYGLNDSGLDHRLFDIPDPERFRQTLQAHGVGVYQTGPRRRLLRELEARQAAGLSIEMRPARRERGIAYVEAPGPGPQLWRIGQRVEIVLRAAEGRFVALIQRTRDMDHVLDTLAPTAILPLTRIEEGVLVLPGPGSTGLEIRAPKGPYRLILVEADEGFTALFAGVELDLLADGDLPASGPRPRRITDQIAQAILARLAAGADVRTTSLEYFVD